MSVFKTISKIAEFLSLVKDYEPGYSSETANDGYMLIEHKGKRYAVKLTELSEGETPKMTVWSEAEAIAAGNLYLTLQLAKDIDVRWASSSLTERYMVLDHDGKSYNLKLSEINHPSENIFDDIKNLRYLV